MSTNGIKQIAVLRQIKINIFFFFFFVILNMKNMKKIQTAYPKCWEHIQRWVSPIDISSHNREDSLEKYQKAQQS